MSSQCIYIHHDVDVMHHEQYCSAHAAHVSERCKLICVWRVWKFIFWRRKNKQDLILVDIMDDSVGKNVKQLVRIKRLAIEQWLEK